MSEKKLNLVWSKSSGSEPPMELTERVANLEIDMRDVRDRLLRVETRLDTFATKEDLHKEIGAQTWRIVGAMITFGTLLTGITFFIARNIH